MNMEYEYDVVVFRALPRLGSMLKNKISKLTVSLFSYSC
jgi:hypothetical protein